MPKYNDIEVKLSGQDGNGFMIVGRVAREIRRHYGDDAASEYTNEATSGDYNNLLSVTADYVHVY